jgi:hypothetical protein
MEIYEKPIIQLHRGPGSSGMGRIGDGGTESGHLGQ